MDKPLTKSQREYIRHRVAGLSQRQAYLKAYPHTSKWHPESVDNAAYRLEHHAEVMPRLREAQQRRLDDAINNGIVEGRDVLRELALVGFAKATDFVTIETYEYPEIDLTSGEIKEYRKSVRVDIKSTNEVPEEKLAAIAGIKQGANGIEIKLHPKVPALSKLGEALGIFGSDQAAEPEDDGFLDALKGTVAETWEE